MGGFEGLPVQPEGEGQIIQLPEDPVRVEALRTKLEEYRERLSRDQYKAPEIQEVLGYRIAILEELLSNGSVNTWDLSRRLNDERGPIQVGVFESACRIVTDYINTGGKNNLGGTGLGKK